jgi:ribosomal protein L40E
VAQGPSIGGAIGLVVVGLFLAIIGGVIWGACSAQPTINGVAPQCGAPAAFAVIGIVILVIGIVAAVIAAASSPRTIYPSTDPAVPPPLIQPVVVQQTVVQQTVEVRCRYCGSLNPVTATKCTACGAAL